MDMFKKAWNGQLSLAKAFWLIYVVVGIILGLIVSLVLSMMVANYNYQAYSSMIGAIVFPYTLFSAICVWRCGKNSSKVWDILSKIVVVLGVLGGIYNIAAALGMVGGTMPPATPTPIETTPAA